MQSSKDEKIDDLANEVENHVLFFSKIEVAKKEAVAKREAEELVKETAVKVDLEAPDVAPVQQTSHAEEMVDTAPILEDKAETSKYAEPMYTVLCDSLEM